MRHNTRNPFSILNFFFCGPEVPPSRHRAPDGRISVLYLLRRSIISCYNTRIIPESRLLRHFDNNDAKRLWPGTIVVFCGIDYLAKFYAGSDNQGKAGERFKKYVEYFFRHLKQNQIDALWRVRCSLMHSFGLYDPKLSKPVVVDEAYPPRCVSETTRQLTLHYKSLYDEFVTSVLAYNGLLMGRQEVVRNFNLMAQHYGYLRVQGRIR
jgi:hypothetical protein